jgi:hypothetical protein
MRLTAQGKGQPQGCPFFMRATFAAVNVDFFTTIPQD